MHKCFQSIFHCGQGRDRHERNITCEPSFIKILVRNVVFKKNLKILLLVSRLILSKFEHAFTIFPPMLMMKRFIANQSDSEISVGYSK